ncbi:SpoIIE family protein phosphatase [Streptacidiphilus sp. N1-3]|uniref:SpoIIE family protein phosphatase n=1 Tax=Streptacidiphilus alkalitolerans TaxID=3342712 RepID=A0ABV6X7H8_9ACTN
MDSNEQRVDEADGGRTAASRDAHDGTLLAVPIATALIEGSGRILHWNADAELLLGYTADEAVGAFAVQLLATPEQRPGVLDLFGGIVAGQPWSGVFPVRHRDGHLVSLEFRTYPIAGPGGAPLVLAVASDVRALRRVEADLTVLDSFFSQSPVGMAVYDPDLRFVRLNSALAQINGVPVEEHLGRRTADVLPGINGAEIETVMQHVLESGEPVVDARSHGRTPGDPTQDRAWSASYFRLEEPSGRVLGVSSTIVEVTARFLAESRAARARDRLELLVDATSRIGTTLDLGQTARELAEAMVPRVADLSGVFVLDRLVAGHTAETTETADGAERVRQLALVSSDPGFDAPVTDLSAGAVYDVPADSPYAEAMATGRTVVVPAQSLPPLTPTVPSEHPQADLGLGSRAVRVTPLVARGMVLGMVVYSRRSDRDAFEWEDITLGDELASRAAVAIDNARLYLREHETLMALQQALRESGTAHTRLALLKDASTRIGTTLDLQRTAEELVEVVIPRFADFATVDLLESIVQGGEQEREQAPVPDDGRMLLRAMAVGEASGAGVTGAADQIGQTSWSAKLYAESLRSGRSILVPVVDEAAMHRITGHPERVQPGLDAGIHSYLMVPLLARGTVLGGAEFIRTNNPEPFGPADMALAEELVARAAVCFENARLYRRERDTALTLQRSLLPQEVHRTPGLEIAYRYLPSSVVSEVGGDWFDVVPLSCGRVALVVGDVMGHGIRAAATMGQLRTAARTLITMDLTPDRLLQRLDETASAIGEGQFATCVCAVFDPVDRSCSIASAGHPPPVVAEPDGSARLLDLPPGPPLGVGGVSFECVEFTLLEGSLLVLYTDGLVERRDRDLDVGLDLLSRTVAERRGSLEQSCDSVLAAMSAGDSDDDIAMIMARALPVHEDWIAGFPLSADIAVVRKAREFARATLADWGLSSLSEFTELLVSELVSNALLHGGAPTQLRLFRDRVLTVEVADTDTHPPSLNRASAEDEGGRGMHLVNELAHRWGSRATRHGKVVWLELELPLGFAHRVG